MNYPVARNSGDRGRNRDLPYGRQGLPLVGLSLADSYASASYASVTAARPVAYFAILRRRALILALFAAAGALLTSMAVWKAPYVYQARALLEVQGINDNLLNTRDVNPAAKADNSSGYYINTEARLLQSGPLFERVAAQLNSDAAKAGAPWKPAVTRREIQGSLKVRTHDTDRVMEIAVESSNPRRAAAIANALATGFIEQDMESRWDSSKRTSEWLTREVEGLANKLRNSEQELQAYTVKANLLMGDDDSGGNVAEANLRQVQDELAHAQADRIAKESLYEGGGARQQAGYQGPADSTYDQYQMQITALRKQLAELESTYAPTYYKIPPIKAQIAELEKAAAQQRTVSSDRLAEEYRAAQRREQLLQTQYSTQFRKTADESAKMVRFEALKKQVEMNRTIYGEMLQKVKGYDVASAMQSSNIRVADPAEVPGVPVRPNKPLLAVLGGLGALMAGAFWVVGRAVGDRSIKEPGEAQQYLQSPELGVIPAADARSGLSVRRRRGEPLETVTSSVTPSFLAESFRSTGASLLLHKDAANRPRVLVVTSPSPAEGKTTVASNLAITLAGSVGRVLLIDGDRYRARLHKIFGRKNRKGLSELLQSQHPTEKLPLGAFVVDTPVPNLFLLPSGHTALGNSDPLYSERMTELIARFRREFDVVLIDAPPMLHLPDARILGRLSDGVILVLRAGRVRSETAVAAEQRLRADGTVIIGTVLNDWNPKESGLGIYPDYKRDYAAYFPN